MLTLSEAQKSGRLEEFIAQQKAEGIGPIDRSEFDALLSKVIKAQRPKDRTLHSASGENSSGKKTRPGSDQDVSD